MFGKDGFIIKAETVLKIHHANLLVEYSYGKYTHIRNCVHICMHTHCMHAYMHTRES